MTADHLPLRCGVDHGWECCGCLDHPVGKPWEWNSSAWDEHWSQPTESETEQPADYLGLTHRQIVEEASKCAV